MRAEIMQKSIMPPWQVEIEDFCFLVSALTYPILPDLQEIKLVQPRTIKSDVR